MTALAPLTSAAPLGVSADARRARIDELRGSITRMERSRVDTEGFALDPELAPLLPQGVLRTGAIYAVPHSTALALGLIAAASRAGVWCGVIGFPHFGAEAAAQAGVDLGRLVVVPEAGAQALTVAGALAEVTGLLLLGDPGSVAPGEAARLSSRLRERGASLIVRGEWPGAEARLQIERTQWSGLGSGWGHLRERRVTVEVTGRSLGGRRRVPLLLGGGVAAGDKPEVNSRSLAPLPGQGPGAAPLSAVPSGPAMRPVSAAPAAPAASAAPAAAAPPRSAVPATARHTARTTGSLTAHLPLRWGAPARAEQR